MARAATASSTIRHHSIAAVEFVAFVHRETPRVHTELMVDVDRSHVLEDQPFGRRLVCAGLIAEVTDEFVRISTVDRFTQAVLGAFDFIVGDRETRVVAHHDGVEIVRLPADAVFIGELGQRVCRHAVNPRRAEVDDDDHILCRTALLIDPLGGCTPLQDRPVHRGGKGT